MQATLLPVCLGTILVIVFYLFLHKWISPRLVLLFISLGCFAVISPYGLLVLMVFSIVIYIGGNIIGPRQNTVYYVFLGLGLLPLIAYKIVVAGEPGESLIGVIGISYFTFNGLSYLVDIRRGYLQAERS